MIYIIGGAPRSGKTKLAKRLSRKLSVPIYSTDKLRIQVARKTPVSKIDLMFPFNRMFNGDKVDECFRKYKPEDFLNADKVESGCLIEEIIFFIKQNLSENNDYIIEGVHLLPRYIKKIQLSISEYRIIYLGKIDEHKILNGLKLNKDKRDWIIGHIKKSISLVRASRMVGVYGKFFLKETKKYGFKFLNTEEDFFKKLKEAEKYLMNQERLG